MGWFVDLVSPGNVTLAGTMLLYAFVISVGVYLGKMKIFGVSLGVTFVLFVGILMGHWGYTVAEGTLHFVREFGLILFIFSIGLQVGPGFFSSFKKGGMMLNGLAALVVVLDVVIVLGIYYIDGDTSIATLVGVMSGAVTNTPSLGAAQQALLQVTPEIYSESENMAMGYAAAYPLGVVGIILSMLLLKVIFRVNIDNEAKRLGRESESDDHIPYLGTWEVVNRQIDGSDLAELHRICGNEFVVSRICLCSGQVVVPNLLTKIHVGDKLFIVAEARETPRFDAVIGPRVEMDWEKMPSELVSRNILVTQGDIDGIELRSLKLRTIYHVNATRVNRAGIYLLATPTLRLHVGDRLTVVGEQDDISRLAVRLGNSIKRLDHPNIMTIFVGIMLGILLGSIPINVPGMSVPMKLGLAGGPLIVAILISRFGYKLKLVAYTSNAASLMLREIGICLFLASVGIASGEKFVATVFNVTGMWWVIWGFIITVVPLLIVGCYARLSLKIDYLTIMGFFGGCMTDPPALAFATDSTGRETPAVAYSTVYPLTMFLRVVVAQLLILFLN